MTEPDPIWKAFTFGRSMEDFVAAHPAFVFHPDVPTIIKEHLIDIHILLIHSYYRYRFIDIAQVRAMQVVEMALRVRHQEFGSPDLDTRTKKNGPRTPDFGKLLAWAARSGLIEDTNDRPSWRQYDKKRVDVLRDLRNYVVHASSETLHGVSVVGLIYKVADFVNELYDNVEERMRRHEIERQVQRELNSVVNHGAIIDRNGVRLIIFHAELLFAKQLGDEWTLHLAFLPIFPPLPDDQGIYVLPDPIYLLARSQRFTTDAIYIDLPDGQTIPVRSISDKVNEAKYREFKSEYSNRPILISAVFQALADRRTRLKRRQL
jgi:hypothetical protein